jgi:hypothetical protein
MSRFVWVAESPLVFCMAVYTTAVLQWAGPKTALHRIRLETTPPVELGVGSLGPHASTPFDRRWLGQPCTVTVEGTGCPSVRLHDRTAACRAFLLVLARALLFPLLSPLPSANPLVLA